jgi:hypothetical protein
MIKPRHFILTLASILSVIVFSTCKKYPEDPFISLRTIKMRMAAEWQIEKIEVNGENINYKYSDSLVPLNLTDFYFRFKFHLKDYGDRIPEIMFINKSSKNSHDAENTDVCGITFNLNPKTKFSIAGAPWTYVPQRDLISGNLLLKIWGAGKKWDIKRLYNKQMILEKNINGAIHRIYLKQTRS